VTKTNETVTRKVPTPEFCGVWIPRHVMCLFWEGELSALEVLCLATIESMTKEGQGYYGSNAALASSLGMTRAHSAADMVRRLVEKGLLVRRIVGRNRRLWTRWTARGRAVRGTASTVPRNTVEAVPRYRGGST
jgi:hypothetical protein